MEVVVTAVGVDQAVVEVTTKDGTVIETAEMGRSHKLNILLNSFM